MWSRFLISLGVLACVFAHAPIAHAVNMQAELRDAAGKPVVLIPGAKGAASIRWDKTDSIAVGVQGKDTPTSAVAAAGEGAHPVDPSSSEALAPKSSAASAAGAAPPAESTEPAKTDEAASLENSSAPSGEEKRAVSLEQATRGEGAKSAKPAPENGRYIVRLYATLPKELVVVANLVDPKKLSFNSVKELPDGSRRIDLMVYPQGASTTFELLMVAADGQIEKAPFQLVIPEWDDFQQFKAKGGNRPYRVDAALWMPLAILNGDSVPGATSFSLGARASARMGILKNPFDEPRLEFSAYGAYSFLPLVLIPDATWSIRFLEIGGGVSYLLPWRTASWSFLVQGGWAYKTSFSGEVPYAFGYQTVTGPRLALLVRKQIGVRHLLSWSGYFGLVGGGWFQLAGLDNHDFGGSFQWDWTLAHGHRVFVRADVSYLKLYLSGTSLSTLMTGLAIGYGL